MAIELVDLKVLPDGSVKISDEVIDDAFKVIEAAIKTGHKFNNVQKDLGIRLSVDALAPQERPWFFEIAQSINRIPLWQLLWGCFRRCQEWGTAQAPMLDPGWAHEESMDDQYGMGERPCEECGKVFKPGWQGEMFCSNVCGVAEEKRKIEAVRAANIDLASEPFVEVNEGQGMPQFDIPMPGQDMFARRSQRSGSPHKLLTQRVPVGDDSESLDLGTDYAETEEQ
jgi:hypothetical protein